MDGNSWCLRLCIANLICTSAAEAEACAAEAASRWEDFNALRRAAYRYVRRQTEYEGYGGLLKQDRKYEKGGERHLCGYSGESKDIQSLEEI